MPKYRVYGVVTGSKYIGEYEAVNAEEAEELAWGDAYVGLCHACASECEDPEIQEFTVEEVSDGT